jgi:hypothetical protein
MLAQEGSERLPQLYREDTGLNTFNDRHVDRKRNNNRVRYAEEGGYKNGRGKGGDKAYRNSDYYALVEIRDMTF